MGRSPFLAVEVHESVALGLPALPDEDSLLEAVLFKAACEAAEDEDEDEDEEECRLLDNEGFGLTATGVLVTMGGRCVATELKCLPAVPIEPPEWGVPGA